MINKWRNKEFFTDTKVGEIVLNSYLKQYPTKLNKKTRKDLISNLSLFIYNGMYRKYLGDYYIKKDQFEDYTNYENFISIFSYISPEPFYCPTRYTNRHKLVFQNNSNFQLENFVDNDTFNNSFDIWNKNITENNLSYTVLKHMIKIFQTFRIFEIDKGGMFFSKDSKIKVNNKMTKFLYKDFTTWFQNFKRNISLTDHLYIAYELSKENYNKFILYDNKLKDFKKSSGAIIDISDKKNNKKIEDFILADKTSISNTFKINNLFDKSIKDKYSFYRIFKKHNKNYGRYYGFFNTVLHKEERSNIIETHDLVEIDLSANLINTLYYYKTRKFFDKRFYDTILDQYIKDFDIYDHIGYKKFYTDILKKPMLQIFNSHSYIDCKLSFIKTVRKYNIPILFDDILSTIKKVYPELNEFMFQINSGITQYIESNAITKLIIKLFKKYKLQPLFVHDCIIVPKEYYDIFVKEIYNYLAMEIYLYKAKCYISKVFNKCNITFLYAYINSLLIYINNIYNINLKFP